MAQAALRGYHVLKPWGDSLEYDVAIEHDGNPTRVQVKSTTVRHGTGYFCQVGLIYILVVGFCCRSKTVHLQKFTESASRRPQTCDDVCAVLRNAGALVV